jgi:tetratricopeptide (TPR) repeat protein
MLLSSQWDSAISYFTQLTQQEPDNAGAWYDLGVAWEAFGDWGQALAAYEQAASRERKRTYLDAVTAARRRAPVVTPPTAQQVPQIIPPQ